MEAQVIHHLTHQKSFAVQFGQFLVPEMFPTPAARVVHSAVASIYKDLDDMPGSPEMVEQRLQSLTLRGALPSASMYAAVNYMYDVDDVKDVSSFAPELVALLKGHGSFTLIDSMVKTQQKRGCLTPFMEKIAQLESLGSEEVDTKEWRFLDDDLFEWMAEQGKLERMRTYCAELDVNLSGGLPRGTLTTVLGKTSAGKSFMCNQLCEAAVYSGMDALYISLENPINMVVSRFVAPFVGINSKEIMLDPRINKAPWKAYLKANPHTGRFVPQEYTVGTSVEEIRRQVQKFQKKTGFAPGLVVFDYLLRASSEKIEGGSAHSRYLMAHHIANELIAWGKDENLVMVTAAQATKKVSGVNHYRLTLDDFADSMNIARDSDIVLTVNIKEEADKLDPTRIIKWCEIGVPKHRQGESGQFTSAKLTAYGYGQVYPMDIFDQHKNDYGSTLG